MEVALGCIFVVFGGRGVSRLRLLLNLHGLQCDFQAAQEAARLLRPHSRISLKLVSKYLQLGEEEQRETDLLFSVKKLLSFGYLEPIPFGQKVEIIFNLSKLPMIIFCYTFIRYKLYLGPGYLRSHFFGKI